MLPIEAFCTAVRSADNFMVGVNVVLLENVEVGDNCIIGADCVGLADVIVAQNSMVIGYR